MADRLSDALHQLRHSPWRHRAGAGRRRRCLHCADFLGQGRGRRVWVTSRSLDRGGLALRVGADAAYESGGRLPERVDAVFDSVGAATWAHSLRCLKPGGTIVTCGATSGDAPSAELSRVFFQQLRVIGSPPTMGTRQELVELLNFLIVTGIRPTIDGSCRCRKHVTDSLRWWAGSIFGKVVFTV